MLWRRNSDRRWVSGQAPSGSDAAPSLSLSFAPAQQNRARSLACRQARLCVALRWQSSDVMSQESLHLAEIAPCRSLSPSVTFPWHPNLNDWQGQSAVLEGYELYIFTNTITRVSWGNLGDRSDMRHCKALIRVFSLLVVKTVLRKWWLMLIWDKSVGLAFQDNFGLWPALLPERRALQTDRHPQYTMWHGATEHSPRAWGVHTGQTQRRSMGENHG